MVDIVGEGFDIGFRIGKPKESNLISKQIARNRLLIVAAPEFIKKFGMPTTLSQLADLPAVVYANQGLVLKKFKYLDNLANESLLQLTPAYKVNEVEMLVWIMRPSKLLIITEFG